MRDTEDARFIAHSIDDEQFKSLSGRYKKEIEGVDEQMSNLAKDYDQYIDVLERMLELAENVGKAYKTADYNQRRGFLYMFFKKTL